MPGRCRVVTAENLPFEEYCKRLQESDVLLDQIYSYTPAMNALEAMSRGIVVVSGGEPENYRILHEETLRPVINVQATEESVYEQLRHIALHPEELPQKRREGLEYIRRHHDMDKVAAKYAEIYEALLIV
jgi:glycosyltransferase involved in cell wall biosynthesis